MSKIFSALIHCALGLMGADNLRFIRDLSSAKVSQLCLVTSIPLDVDDPDSKNSFSNIIMDPFNGAKRGTLSDQPLTSDLCPWQALYSFYLAFKSQLMTCTDPYESDKTVCSFVWSHEFTHFFLFLCVKRVPRFFTQLCVKVSNSMLHSTWENDVQFLFRSVSS